MDFLGPKIIKVNGGLGQKAPSDTNVAGLIFLTGLEVDEFTFGVHKFESLDDAEKLGLNRAADINEAANTTAAPWYHISEFFRVNPNGTLYVFNGDSLPDADCFAADGPADQLMAASANAIRFLGVVFGKDPDATITVTNGYDASVGTVRMNAQTWVDARAQDFVYIDCVAIEGRFMVTGGYPTLGDLEMPQILIVDACDHGYFNATDWTQAAFRRCGAVGTALGSIGVRMLSESIGSVVIERLPDEYRGRPNYSLVDTRRNRWVTIGLTSGQLFDDLSQADRTDLGEKNHCFVGQYEGYPGAYFNADRTCTGPTDDFNRVNRNRVWNEAARRVRRALIPRMNSRVQIEPATGRIRPATIADWDAAAKRELQSLLADGEISDFRFTMDPNQDVLAQAKVVTKLSVTPNGIAEAIESEIGFYNPALA